MSIGALASGPTRAIFAVFLQRQGFALVLQQHQAAARDITGLGAVQAAFGVGVGRVILGLADAQVRVLEQAHVVLGGEHFTHGVVDVFLFDLTGLQQPRQFLAIEGVVHAHVDAGLDRQLRGFATVSGDAVLDQLKNRSVIADCQALEAASAWCARSCGTARPGRCVT